MSQAEAGYVRRVEPLATDWRHVAWRGGAFDAGRRSLTPEVEGVIRTPQHVIMVTLRGGARRLEVTTECGHRHRGIDRAGAVSFIPAHCERRLAMTDVAAAWGSISIDPSLLLDPADRPVDLPPFSNAQDDFISAMMAEFEAVHDRDGTLDPLYCEAMTGALTAHLVRRHLPEQRHGQARTWRIAPWRLRRIEAFVEAELGGTIRIADLAGIAELSPGYFQRAFRMTTGQTPLAFINERRIRRAETWLRSGSENVALIAQRVGFSSPTHFTRVYRRITGTNPSAVRGHR